MNQEAIEKIKTGLLYSLMVVIFCSYPVAFIFGIVAPLVTSHTGAIQEMKDAGDKYGWNVVGWYVDEYGREQYLDRLREDAVNNNLSYYDEESNKLFFKETEQEEISVSENESSEHEIDEFYESDGYYGNYEDYDYYENSEGYYNEYTDEYYFSFQDYYDDVLLSGEIVDERVVNCQTYLNVRDEPSTSGSVLCHLYPGTVVYITGMEDSWVYVYDIDRDDPNFEPGWVSDDYLD